MNVRYREPALKAPIPVANTVIWNRGEVLLGRRVNNDAAGLWCCPGGKADQPGTMAETAAREIEEETGVPVNRDQLVPLDLWDSYRAENGQMFVCVFFELNTVEFTHSANEPEKIAEWRWFEPDRLPGKMFNGDRRAVTLSYFNWQPRTNHR